MSNNTNNFLVLADLHWGAIDPEIFRYELDQILFKYIDELYVKDEPIDAIIIAGDLFDTKETFSSLVVRNVIKFIGDLLAYTDDWDTEIILIEGTRTHDNLQLDNLYHVFDTSDYKYRLSVVNNVIGDTIKETTFLYIPEEYVADQESYYSRWFIDSIKHDIIIGHGMVDKVWYAQKAKESQNELTKHMSAPVFKVEDLLKYCNRCYFGHVHTHKRYGDNGRFSYIGPFTNWEFGKDTKVGFYHITKNIDTGEITDKYIENTLAKQYPTIAMSITESITLNDLNDMIDSKIAAVYATTQNVGKIRLIINLSKSIETWQTIKDFLISKLGDMNNVKFALQLLENDSINDDIEVDDSKNYLFDHSIDIYNRIHTFIKNKSGREIPVDTIRKYIDQ